MDASDDHASGSSKEKNGLETGDAGIDPVPPLLQQRHPRIRLHRETLNLLSRVELASGEQGVQDFCNEAIRYVILSGEAATVSYSDLLALGASLDARLDELNVILLHLHQAAADLSLLVEQRRIIGAFAEQLRKFEVQ